MISFTTAKRVLIFSVATLAIAAPQKRTSPRSSSQPVTLLTFRRALLNTPVVLQGGYWEDAVLEGGRYKNVAWSKPTINFPAIGAVLAIQLADGSGEWARPNAFGETRSNLASDPVDPVVNVVVKTASGSIVITTGPTSDYIPKDEWTRHSIYFLPTTPQSKHAEIIKWLLPTVIGKDLFAVHRSVVYEPSAGVADLVAGNSERITGLDMQIRSNGFLKPLQIRKAKYDEESDSVILELALPDQTPVLFLSHYVEREGKSFLSKIEGSLFAEIPAFYSAADVKGLRTGAFVVGMSEYAVYDLMGVPDETNDWGRGGTQLVFAKGAILVYLNAAGRVMDSQSFSR